MSLSFHPSNSPLFLKLGKIIHAGKTLNTARQTTVPTEIEDILDQYATGSIELQSIPDPLADVSDGFKSAGDSLLSTIRDVFQATIIRYVKEDEQQPTDNLEDALRELIRQMIATNTYVEHIAPTATLAEVDADGNGTVAVSAVDRFGKKIPFAYDEVITIECTDDATSSAETFRFRAEPTVAKLAGDWPLGSGLDTTLDAIGPTSRQNLLTNGSFEDADDNDTTLPDGWIHASGTTHTPALSSVEVQTVAISGTPTGGWYQLLFGSRRTVSLAFNAGQSAVQSALRAITGLEQVTVVTTGTTPNFTHTITFTGVTAPGQLTSVSGLTGGTPAIGHATTTAGSDNVYRGARSWSFTGDGSSTGLLLRQHLPTLQPSTVYGFSVAVMRSGSSPSAGVMVAELNDLDGDPTTDDAGTSNQVSIAYTAISTTYALVTGFFRTPAALPTAMQLDLRVSTAFTSGTVVHLDSIVLTPATELYVGGPYVVVFAGNVDFRAADLFTLTVANAYTAEFQQWFQRLCDTDALELQLPSASGTSASTNEVQTLTITGTPTGGTFTISYDGQTTATIAYNANAAAVQSALEALSNIEVGDVTCGGGALPGTPVTITFTGNLAGRNVSLMTADGAGLTGGSTPTAAIALTTAGVGYISDSVFIT